MIGAVAVLTSQQLADGPVKKAGPYTKRVVFSTLMHHTPCFALTSEECSMFDVAVAMLLAQTSLVCVPSDDPVLLQ